MAVNQPEGWGNERAAREPSRVINSLLLRVIVLNERCGSRVIYARTKVCRSR